MTADAARAKLVAWANNQVGYREGENNRNKYADSAAAGYSWNIQNQPWCDIFVDAGFIECFGVEAAAAMTYQPRGSFSALCSASAQLYRNNRAYYYEPQLGDQAFFYVGGAINHTGIVVAVAPGRITTVEGNSSDSVARRTYAIDSPQIAGYGRPNWAVVAKDTDVPTTPETPAVGSDAAAAPSFRYSPAAYAAEGNVLKNGCYGPQVKNVQRLLTAHGFDCGGVDGKFGPETRAALVKFQKAAGIAADGEFGGQSFKALWNYGGGEG